MSYTGQDVYAKGRGFHIEHNILEVLNINVTSPSEQ